MTRKPTRQTILRWEDLPDEHGGLAVSRRIGEVLESWRRTPYAEAQRCKGVGVDCVRFVCSVFDELDGRVGIPLDEVPPDTAMHAPETARAAMRKIIEAYGPAESVPLDRPLHPGDLVVAGPPDGGPGHALFVGAAPNTLWHASRGGVVWTGIVVHHLEVFRGYRIPRKSDWGAA